MPIRPELRPLYPPHWRELSARVRFERAGGRCQGCGRPHLAQLRCLPDGRWFDESATTWRDQRGRSARWPDLVEATRLRTTRVVLAAAHLDSDPTNNRLANLKSLCQRCHMLHDRPHHLAQRWITYRRRYALATCFSAFTNSVCVMLGDHDHGRDDRQGVGRSCTPVPTRAACSKPWTSWICCAALTTTTATHQLCSKAVMPQWQF